MMIQINMVSKGNKIKGEKNYVHLRGEFLTPTI